MRALDLFAGPGGWDVAAAELGIHPLGIELDDAACATRDAIGHRTMQADVSELNPADFASCDLLIASPPCQAWSMAGKRGGEADKGLVYELTDHIVQGRDIVNPVTGWEDERSRLVTEPLRWALALRPRFIALEQVPPVLDYWKHIAEILRAEGYGVWTGILEAERYGVPQTRERAILMAELDGNPHPPAPTHQRYIPGEPQWSEPKGNLFGTLLPWRSMAQALGWCETEATGQATAYGEGMVERYGERQPRQASAPAPHITGKTRSWERVNVPAPTVTGGGSDTGGPEVFGRGGRERIKVAMAKKEDRPERKAQGAGNQPRSVDTPAATLDTRTDLAHRVEERPAPTIVTTRRSDQGIIVGRQLPEGEGRNVGGHGWTEDRPSTAVCADPRISPPGYRGRAEDYDAEGNYKGKRSMDNAVRVSVAEAAILQGFDPTYPWQGSRTKQFQQIGNAFPPPLAQAVLTELCASALPQDRKEAA